MDGAGYQNGAIARVLTLPNRNKHLLLGPWDHGARINVSPWRRAETPEFALDGELLRFFDTYHQAPVGERNRIGLFAGSGLFPLIEVIDGNEASPSLECIAEGRFALDPLGFGVDVAKPTLDPLPIVRYVSSMRPRI